MNAEMQRSFDLIMRRIEADPAGYRNSVSKLDGYVLALSWKFQYRPQDHFVLDFLPGYPQALQDTSFESLNADIVQLRREWKKYSATILHKMEHGLLMQSEGRPYNAREVDFARTKNPRPNFVFSIEKRIPTSEIEKLGKKIVPAICAELRKLRPMLEFLVGGTAHSRH